MTQTNKHLTLHRIRPGLWTRRDAWMVPCKLLDGATIDHVVVIPGATIWFVARPANCCPELARQFRAERASLSVPLDAFHTCYRDAITAAAEARHNLPARQMEREVVA